MINELCGSPDSISTLMASHNFLKWLNITNLAPNLSKIQSKFDGESESH